MKEDVSLFDASFFNFSADVASVSVSATKVKPQSKFFS